MPGRKSHKPRTFENVMDEAGEDAFPWDLDEHLHGCLFGYQTDSELRSRSVFRPRDFVGHSPRRRQSAPRLESSIQTSWIKTG